MPSIQVKDSDLYQNGRIIDLGDGEQILIRETLQPKQELGDSYIKPKEGDDLRLLGYFAYKEVVKNANQYWWLIADRNNFFNPLEGTVVVGDGDIVPMQDIEIVLPNILKQQPEFGVR
jgi:hypothetical protein